MVTVSKDVLTHYKAELARYQEQAAKSAQWYERQIRRLHQAVGAMEFAQSKVEP